MAKCWDYKSKAKCPKFYECSKENDVVKDGKGSKKLEIYCYYCKAGPRVKKIGHKATWTGLTPKWCPLGRDESEGRQA